MSDKFTCSLFVLQHMENLLKLRKAPASEAKAKAKAKAKANAKAKAKANLH